MRKYLALLRVSHWIKNLFLFIPLFFAGELFVISKLTQTGISFLAFSLMASAIYIINDYRDLRMDRIHPTKKYRPLASGQVSVRAGFILLVVCFVISATIAYLIDTWFFVIILAYFIQNLGYSFGLKKISVLDIIILSLGFVYRVLAGGVVGDVYVSQWLVIMVFLLAMFLALAKRRDDLVLSIQLGKVTRVSSQDYNLGYLDTVLAMLSGITIVSYVMYTISDEVVERFQTEYVYSTAIFVVAGILRYLQITLVEQNSSSPTDILRTDNFIRLVILGWMLSFFFIIYII